MDTIARIKEMAAKEFSIDPNAVDQNAPLDTLGVDSLSFIEFMFKIEEELGVSARYRGRQVYARKGAR